MTMRRLWRIDDGVLLALLIALSTLTAASGEAIEPADGGIAPSPAGEQSASAAGDTVPAAGAATPERPETWDLCGQKVPGDLQGRRFVEFVEDSLATPINPHPVLALHAVPLSDGMTPAQVERQLATCDDLKTSVPPGEWEIFVVAFAYEQLAGAMFAFDLPADWEVRGFRLSPELGNPFSMGGVLVDDPRPKLVAFDCIGHPERSCWLLPMMTAVEKPVTVIGSLGISAATPGAITLAAHPNPEYGLPQITSCHATTHVLPLTALGRVDVARGPGLRPCDAGERLAEIAVATAAEAASAGATGVATTAGAAVGVAATADAASDEVLVRVGAHEIDRATFEEGFAKFQRDTTLTEDENRAKYLKSLVDRHLMLLQAEEEGFLAANPQLDKLATDFEDYLIDRRVRDRYVFDRIEFSDQDVRDFYDKHAVTYDVSQILVPTEDEALAALQRLENGESFDLVAMDVSVDAKSRREGGQLKPFVWGTTSPRFMEVISALAPGEISAPVKSEYGYHIFRLNQAIPRQQEPFEARRDFMAQQLRMRIGAEIQRDFYRMLEERYDYVTHLDVARQLAGIYADALEDAEEAEPYADQDRWASLAQQAVVIPDSLANAKLAEWDTRAYTVQDNWNYVRSLPAAILIDRRNPYMILGDAGSEFRSRAIIRLGREEGLGEDPEILAAGALKREELALTFFYQRHVVEAATFTEADERQYYQDNIARFTLLPAVRVQRVSYRTAEPAIAMEAALQGEAKVDPDSLLEHQQAAGLVARADMGGVWVTERRDPLLYERAATMDSLEVGRVLDAEDYWTTFRLIEHDDTRIQPFEEVRNQIQKDLQIIRSERVLNEYLDELRDKYEVWVAPELSGLSGELVPAAGSDHEGRLATSEPAAVAAPLMAAAGGDVATAADAERVADENAVIVAQVGERRITLEEFNKLFSRQQPNPETNRDEQRVEFLESLVNKELMVLGARERGDFDNEQVLEDLAAFTDRIIGDEIERRATTVDSTITEEDVRRAFELSKHQVLLRHIMHWAREPADSARARIDQGEDFATVAAEVSIVPGADERGGLLNWLAYRDLIPEFLKVVEPMAIGDVAGPFESTFGVHIIRLEDRREREGADLDSEREALEMDVIRSRRFRANTAFRSELEERYHFEVDKPEIVRVSTEAKEALLQAAADTTLAKLPLAERWAPDADELAVELATYDGGSVTVADYRQLVFSFGLEMYSHLNPASAIQDVRYAGYRRMRVLEARHQGLLEDPAIQERVRLKHEELAVTRFYENTVLSDLEVSDEEARAYYHANLDRFKRRERVRYAYLTVDDASVAAAVAASLGEALGRAQDEPADADTTTTKPLFAGEKLLEATVAARFDSLREALADAGHLIHGARDTGYLTPERALPEVLEAGRSMETMTVGQVMEAGGSHTVFVLIDHTPERVLTFEESRQAALANVRTERAEERLQAYLSEQQARTPVKSFPERVRGSGE